MKITIESTSHITEVNGVPARVWQGRTESGVDIICFITRVAIDKDEKKTEEFIKDLAEQSPPAFPGLPLRMII